jgi:hypothetical protein
VTFKQRVHSSSGLVYLTVVMVSLTVSDPTRTTLTCIMPVIQVKLSSITHHVILRNTNSEKSGYPGFNVYLSLARDVFSDEATPLLAVAKAESNY